MTPLSVSILSAVAATLLILVVLELIRRSRLHEKYAVLWLATSILILVLSLWRGGLGTIASFVGVSYAPAVLFAVGVFFVLVVLLHYSTVISKHEDRTRRLAQEVALLRSELHRYSGQTGTSRPDSDDAP